MRILVHSMIHMLTHQVLIQGPPKNLVDFGEAPILIAEYLVALAKAMKLGNGWHRHWWADGRGGIHSSLGLNIRGRVMTRQHPCLSCGRDSPTRRRRRRFARHDDGKVSPMVYRTISIHAHAPHITLPST